MSRLNGTVAAVLVASVVAWSVSAFAQAKIVDGPDVRWKLAAWGKPRTGTANVEKLKAFMDERTAGMFKIQIGYESFGKANLGGASVPPLSSAATAPQAR